MDSIILKIINYWLLISLEIALFSKVLIISLFVILKIWFSSFFAVCFWHKTSPLSIFSTHGLARWGQHHVRYSKSHSYQTFSITIWAKVVHSLQCISLVMYKWLKIILLTSINKLDKKNWNITFFFFSFIIVILHFLAKE